MILFISGTREKSSCIYDSKILNSDEHELASEIFFNMFELTGGWDERKNPCC